MSGVTRSGADYYDVHLGFWTNWAHGKIQGATVTLSRRNGGLLIAFIALFVAAAGRSFWRIGCFLLHRQQSSSMPQDGLYHQTQAILRNSETGGSALWDLMLMATAWRRRTKHAALRLAPIMILASATIAAFSVAGIYSSHVTTDAANEVLLTGKKCGLVQDVDNVDVKNVVLSYFSERTQAYLNYAQQCYTGAQNPEDCRQYTRPSIPLRIDRKANCPFADKMCKTKDSNLIVDTGFINSNYDLGINLPIESQVLLRFVTHCAPLVTDGYSQPYNDSKRPPIPYMRYYYGSRARATKIVDYYQSPIDLTYKEYNKENNTWEYGGTFGRPEYTIGTLSKLLGLPCCLSFEPIPELARSDADVTIFFLSAQEIVYTAPVDDLWFSAHSDGGPLASMRDASHWDSIPSYKQDEAASPLGCTMQAQMCNPNLPETTRCQTMTGGLESVSNASKLWENSTSREGVEWISRLLLARFSPVQDIVDQGGSAVLEARFGQMGRTLQSPPVDQWQNEVVRWVAASMTNLQALFVETAMGIKDGPVANFTVAPNNTEERRICTSQRIVSARYSSFSVLGLSLILIIGGILITIEYMLEPLTDYLEKKRSWCSYARLEWQTNATLQLQRLAHEETGIGTWDNVKDSIPVTKPGDTLAVLDTLDGRHPRLQHKVPSTAGASTTEQIKLEFDDLPEKLPLYTCDSNSGSITSKRRASCNI